MNAGETRSEEARAAALAQRIQALENELKEAHAELVGVHSRLLFERQSFYADTHTAATMNTSAAITRSLNVEQERKPDPIHIEPLPIHHPLRRKWSLGKGLPPSSEAENQHRVCFMGRQSTNGKLRLFGLLSDGEPWEHYVPFSMLVREGGITIGRDPESTDLQLPENGVSRTHACIELGATGLVISDLNSTNGIQVNEQHLNSYNPQAPIYDGTVIHLGDTALRAEIVYSTQE